MKNKQTIVNIVRATLFLPLLLAVATHTLAQAGNGGASEKKRAELYQELVQEYREQVKEQQQRIENLKAQADNLQLLNQQQEAKVAELQKLVQSLEADKKDLRDNLVTQKEMQRNNEQAIKDRDEVIKVLAKGKQRSSLEKIVASVPAVAGIIALALIR